MWKLLIVMYAQKLTAVFRFIRLNKTVHSVQCIVLHEFHAELLFVQNVTCKWET